MDAALPARDSRLATGIWPDRARAAAFSWRGPGVIALAASSRPAREAVIPTGPAAPVGAAEEADAPLAIQRAEQAAGVRALAASSPELAVAVQRFFQAGGESCLALAMDSGGRGGWRSRLAALAEREDMGTIAVLGAEAGLGEWLLELAAKREDLFFLCEVAAAPGRRAEAAAGAHPAAGSLPPDTFALQLFRENVALVSGPPGPGGEERAAAIGRLLGYLDAATFREEESFAPPRPAAPPWLAERDRAAIEEWRFREGLRRSVDWATRWVVFELHHPIVWRAVEREAGAFLDRLVRRRVLIAGQDAPAFEVSCVAPPRAAGSGAEKRAEAAAGRKKGAPAPPAEAPRVEVRVRARWRGAAPAAARGRV